MMRAGTAVPLTNKKVTAVSVFGNTVRAKAISAHPLANRIKRQ
jgi:hypothetical protein